jgi:hypothetical protein
LTPESTINLLEQWKRGETPQVGPQNGRNCSEGPQGRTSLRKPDDINGIHERDFAEIKAQYDEAKAKAAAAAAAAKK